MNSRRLERLRPDEIADELSACPLFYVPLGVIEWHGKHLPVGLDGLAADSLCLAAAERTGGLVWPILYVGTGGGHTDYPWTHLGSAAVLEAVLTSLLLRLAEWPLRGIVLFSGHFADEQRAVLTSLAEKNSGLTLAVCALTAHDCGHLDCPLDHAGWFETALLGESHPELIVTAALPREERSETNQYGMQRHDPAHPLYGIFGPDPRSWHPGAGEKIRENLVQWLAEKANALVSRSEKSYQPSG